MSDEIWSFKIHVSEADLRSLGGRKGIGGADKDVARTVVDTSAKYVFGGREGIRTLGQGISNE